MLSMKKNEKTLRIEQNYPAPIAATCRKIRVLDEDDVVAKHDSLGDLAEAVIKYLAIISLQDIRDTGGLPEYFSKFLQNILNPSLGHWNEILRMCSQETNDQNKVASSVKQFYESSIKDAAREPINQITSLLKSKMKVRKNKDLLSLLILYRNKIWKGHGSKLTSEEYRSILDALNEVLMYFISEVEFVTDYELIYVDEIVVLPTGEFKHKIQRGMGSQVEPEAFNLTYAMKTNHVYIKISGDEEMQYIDLHPLLVSYPCPDCKSQQFYFFNDYRKNRLEFLSYSCGHLIYPDMLPNEVENFLNVSLAGAGKTAQAYENLDEETQTTQLIKSAKLKISTKEYHEALDLFLTANSIRTYSKC